MIVYSKLIEFTDYTLSDATSFGIVSDIYGARPAAWGLVRRGVASIRLYPLSENSDDFGLT